MHSSLSGLYLFAKFCFVNMLVYSTMQNMVPGIEVIVPEVITADFDASCHADSAVCLNGKALRILETLETLQKTYLVEWETWVTQASPSLCSSCTARRVIINNLQFCLTKKRDLGIAFG